MLPRSAKIEPNHPPFPSFSPIFSPSILSVPISITRYTNLLAIEASLRLNFKKKGKNVEGLFIRGERDIERGDGLPYLTKKPVLSPDIN